MLADFSGMGPGVQPIRRCEHTSGGVEAGRRGVVSFEGFLNGSGSRFYLMKSPKQGLSSCPIRGFQPKMALGDYTLRTFPGVCSFAVSGWVPPICAHLTAVRTLLIVSDIAQGIRKYALYGDGTVMACDHHVARSKFIARDMIDPRF